jgi:hypothetical protein
MSTLGSNHSRRVLERAGAQAEKEVFVSMRKGEMAQGLQYTVPGSTGAPNTFSL